MLEEPQEDQCGWRVVPEARSGMGRGELREKDMMGIVGRAPGAWSIVWERSRNWQQGYEVGGFCHSGWLVVVDRGAVDGFRMYLEVEDC